jgi:Holliday junction DNA helicase RuvB
MNKDINMTEATTGERVRAQSWDEFVGQSTLKRRLTTHIDAARNEGRALDHMLLVAPPGSGKTTLAKLIADRLGDDFADFMMPMDLKQLVRFIGRWRGGVLLLDEIHRAPKAFQESLLSIEQGYIQMPTGQRVEVGHVTFICATTEPQGVIKPLWDRLLVKPVWEDYSDEDMARIITGMAERSGLVVAEQVAAGLARATGGTPRVAGSLVVALRDLAVTDQEVSVETILDLTGLDVDGLTGQHVAYLHTLQALGGQSGLANVCSLLQLPPPVVQDLERLLIKRGFVALESNGRTLTTMGAAKLPGSTGMPPSQRRLRRAS